MREMKKTGVVWCPSIPSDWELRRVKDCFTISKVKAGIKNPTVLKLARSGIQVKDVTVNEGQMAESYDDYNPVQIGDLLLNPMDLYSGANCNVSEVEGVISPAYVNLRAKARLNPFYFDYYFKLQYWAMAMFAHGKGVSYDNRWTINAEGVKSYEVPFPTIEEQNRIVEIIKNKCSQIDALIANAEQQITKLKAYKQSVITETVTKGLNPDVPMKDSGVEWIGEIPEHWNIIRKLSYVTTEGISYGIVKLFDPDDNGVKVLRCSDVLEGNICTDNIRTVTKEVSQEYSRTILSGGEVVVNVRGSLGGCSVVPNDMAGYNIAREVAKISPDASIHNRYLMYYLLSHCFVDYRTRYLAGSVYIGLNIELLSSCPIPFPELFEQQQIADYLDHKCSQIDKLIALKQQKIEKLQQYKRSLIYEYVTGKKEV